MRVTGWHWRVQVGLGAFAACALLSGGPGSAAAAPAVPVPPRTPVVVVPPPSTIGRPQVTFTVNIKNAPDLQPFSDQAVKVCEEWYPKIALMLPDPGYVPPDHIDLLITPDYKGVAATAGTRIFCSVDYFRAHPDDVGALVHETVHVIQHYGRGYKPGWLVEGIADYIRWHFYEPIPRPGRLDPTKVSYTDSYRHTGAFLAFVTAKYGKDIVAPLNSALRAGTYQDTLWKDLTGKTLPELNQAWRDSLTPAPQP